MTLSLLCLEVRAVGMCKTFVTNRLHSSPHFVGGGGMHTGCVFLSFLGMYAGALSHSLSFRPHVSLGAKRLETRDSPPSEGLCLYLAAPSLLFSSLFAPRDTSGRNEREREREGGSVDTERESASSSASEERARDRKTKPVCFPPPPQRGCVVYWYSVTTTPQWIRSNLYTAVDTSARAA